MKNYKYILCFFVMFSLHTYSQSKNVKILFSLNENYKITIEDGKYHNTDTVFFEKSNKKLFFLNNEIYFNKKKIYCFDNVLYYEDFLYIKINKIKYLYVYPHYINREGPYIWYGLGVLIKFSKKLTISENIDYYDKGDLWRISSLNLTKCKIRNTKIRGCADGSLR